VLYRPVYPTVKCSRGTISTNANNNATASKSSVPSTPKASTTSEGLKVGSVPKDVPIMGQPKAWNQKPGTSSSFASPSSNKSTTLSNSNLITATQTTSSAAIPDGGQSNKSTSKPETSGFSSITATVHVHRDTEQQSSSKSIISTKPPPLTAAINAEASSSSSSSKQRPKKLHLTQINSPTTTPGNDFGKGMHVSFDKNLINPLTTGKESCASTKPPSSSSDDKCGQEKEGKAGGGGVVVKAQETCLDDVQVKSAAVDIAVQKIEKDNTDAKSSLEGDPGKVPVKSDTSKESQWY
jgi:hypothetical protein